MSSTIQLGILLGKDTSRGCFPSQTHPMCTYRLEVDYKGSTKLYSTGYIELMSLMRSTTFRNAGCIHD
jgi:hypothetical protein